MTPYFATVTRTSWLSPGLVRVTVHGPSLHTFPSTGIGDEYVRIHFPDTDGRLREPEVQPDGDWRFEGEYPHVQPYTIRQYDAARGEVDIDFVVHGHGRASLWAAAAKPGDRILFGQPRSLYDAPRDVRECVFVTDATGIPALARLLEQLQSEAHALVFVEVADASHRIELHSEATLDVRWFDARGNGVAPSAMTEAIAGVELHPDAYVWVAGEANELSHTRRHLKRERSHAAALTKVIGYWRDENVERAA